MSLSGLLLALLLPTGPFGPEERIVWQQRLHWPETYESSWIASWGARPPENAGLRLYPLDTTLYLVQVETYHHPELSRQIFYLYDQNSSTGNLLKLAWLSRPPGQKLQAQEASELTGQASFSSSDKVLSLLTNEGCGQLIRWRFIKGQPMLKEVRARDCSAATSAPRPDNWPRIWP